MCSSASRRDGVCHFTARLRKRCPGACVGRTRRTPYTEEPFHMAAKKTAKKKTAKKASTKKAGAKKTKR